MGAFRYRFEPLLERRRNAERRAKQALAEARHALLEAAGIVKAMRMRDGALRVSMRIAPVVSCADFAWFDDALRANALRCRSAAETQRLLAERALWCRETLERASRARDALERHRCRALEAHRGEAEHREARELDEANRLLQARMRR